MAAVVFSVRSSTAIASREKAFQIFMPIEVRGQESVNLLAVWAFNHHAKLAAGPDSAITAEVIERYQPFLKSTPAIVAGDFNANVQWDAIGEYAKVSKVDSDLRELSITSVLTTRSVVARWVR